MGWGGAEVQMRLLLKSCCNQHGEERKKVTNQLRIASECRRKGQNVASGTPR